MALKDYQIYKCDYRTLGLKGETTESLQEYGALAMDCSDSSVGRSQNWINETGLLSVSSDSSSFGSHHGETDYDVTSVMEQIPSNHDLEIRNISLDIDLSIFIGDIEDFINSESINDQVATTPMVPYFHEVIPEVDPFDNSNNDNESVLSFGWTGELDPVSNDDDDDNYMNVDEPLNCPYLPFVDYGEDPYPWMEEVHGNEIEDYRFEIDSILEWLFPRD